MKVADIWIPSSAHIQWCKVLDSLSLKIPLFLTQKERSDTSSRKNHGTQPEVSSQDPHHQIQGAGLLLLAGSLPKQRAAVWGWDISCRDLFHRSATSQGKKPLQPKLDAAKGEWNSPPGTYPAPGPSDYLPWYFPLKGWALNLVFRACPNQLEEDWNSLIPSATVLHPEWDGKTLYQETGPLGFNTVLTQHVTRLHASGFPHKKMGKQGYEDCSSSCRVSSISINEPLCQCSSLFILFRYHCLFLFSFLVRIYSKGR